MKRLLRRRSRRRREGIGYRCVLDCQANGVVIRTEATKAKAKKYQINDGKLLLTLEEAEEGGFVVTSPMYPGLVTGAESLSRTFEMAHDALATLHRGWAKMERERRKKKSA